MKKLMSICLSLALVFSLITVPSIGVYAETAEDGVELKLGKTVEAGFVESDMFYERYFTFTPSETTAVQFQIPNVDVDEDGYSLVSFIMMDIETGELTDIAIECGNKLLLTTNKKLTKGKTYHFIAEYYGEDSDYTIKVKTKKYTLNPLTLKLGTTVKKTFSTNRNVVEQRINFTAPANERYEFEVVNPYATKDNFAETSIELFNAKGKSLAANYSWDTSPLITAPYNKLVAGNQYYLIVTCISPTDYTAKIKVRKHAHDWDTLYGEGKTVHAWCPICFNSKDGKVSASLSTATFVYNGKVRKPTVTVKCTNGITLPKSAYTITNTGRKNVGKGTVTIKFKGDYSDLNTIKKTYKINPKGTSIDTLSSGSKTFTVKWKKKTVQTTGYQVRYSTYSSMKDAQKTKLITSNTKTSKKVSGLKANKKYYVQVRTYKNVDGVKYYSSWSKAKTVTTK